MCSEPVLAVGGSIREKRKLTGTETDIVGATASKKLRAESGDQWEASYFIELRENVGLKLREHWPNQEEAEPSDANVPGVVTYAQELIFYHVNHPEYCDVMGCQHSTALDHEQSFRIWKRFKQKTEPQFWADLALEIVRATKDWVFDHMNEIEETNLFQFSSKSISCQE
jgi:hypothetical protein